MYMLTGIILAILYYCNVIKQEYLITLGVTIFAIGALGLIKYKKITKNKEAIEARRIMETDERNIAIMHKAKSAAFGIYICITGILVVIFELTGKTERASDLAWNICSLVALYWICYFVYNKKT